jgi:hypothetical protein
LQKIKFDKQERESSAGTIDRYIMPGEKSVILRILSNFSQTEFFSKISLNYGNTGNILSGGIPDGEGITIGFCSMSRLQGHGMGGFACPQEGHKNQIPLYPLRSCHKPRNMLAMPYKGVVKALRFRRKKREKTGCQI